ncbi:hypothetical protein GYMLUDRAFT_1009222 [Collybiopsis luxurians FD-317 M1]|uniref:Uncharacterized protein n=1 Tax=Collybiopsis luxurians FD-317 M1 TaxID=944289 RepID=A0A0D0C5P5_9AGAR|nr:hypothetical protein GYMLUDRAFT_1009222 [Collybiopsis luxurians FD-317 M1]
MKVDRYLRGELDETKLYSIMNYALTKHTDILEEAGCETTVFPQLRIRWNPDDPQDKRNIIPDMGLGFLLVDGRLILQGGAELKKATERMRDQPDPSVLQRDSDVIISVTQAGVQASDQIKAAIKSGMLPSDKKITWIVMIGPYFILKRWNPFTADELQTRGHRPNDSGEVKAAEALKKSKESRANIKETMYRLGTPEAAIALHNYITKGGVF